MSPEPDIKKHCDAESTYMYYIVEYTVVVIVCLQYAAQLATAGWTSVFPAP